MLADRDAESLTSWLREHPTIRIIARDRAGAYAETATKGAPGAVQVADRFHLLRNLSETLLVVCEQHAKQLCRLNAPSPAAAAPPSAVEQVAPAVTDVLVRTIPPPTPSPRHRAQAEQRRALRLSRYEQARALHDQGWPLRAIGRELALNRNTVRKYVRAASFPERAPRLSVHRKQSLVEDGRLNPDVLFLQKPFSRATLAHTVRAALEVQAVGATSAHGLVG